MGYVNTAVDCMMDGPMGYVNTAVDCMMDGPIAWDQFRGSVQKPCNLHLSGTDQWWRSESL